MFFIAAHNPDWPGKHGDLSYVALDHPSVAALLPVVQAEMKTLGIGCHQLLAIEGTQAEFSRKIPHIEPEAQWVGEFVPAENNQVHRELVANSGSTHEFSVFVRSGHTVTSVCQKCGARIRLTPDGAHLPTKRCSTLTVAVKT